MVNTAIDSFIKNVGLRVRDLRNERKMTQLDVAVKANLDESQIQRLERARSAPTFKTLYKVVVDGLGVEFSTFFTFPEKFEEAKK